jgi:hypothetical protein
MSKRQELKEQRRRQSKISNIVWGSGLLILFAIVGYFIWSSTTTPATPPGTETPASSSTSSASLVGQAVTVDSNRDHIDDGADPGQYSTNPPTSGHHYPTWLEAGFYDTNTRTFPQGYLVHNLEHGYIIFWYNCKSLNDSQCSELKAQIKSVMDAAGNFKVIAYPWDSIDNPLVMTSWGFMQPFRTFDASLASSFIDQHRNRAPEPDAP